MFLTFCSPVWDFICLPFYSVILRDTSCKNMNAYYYLQISCCNVQTEGQLFRSFYTIPFFTLLNNKIISYITIYNSQFWINKYCDIIQGILLFQCLPEQESPCILNELIYSCRFYRASKGQSNFEFFQNLKDHFATREQITRT